MIAGLGTLGAVLREALARDECKREGISKKDALRKVASFIQNIHHFRDEALSNPKAPYERVVVFDEAQRAWTQDQAAKFMHTKRGHSNFNMSEPEFLISVMGRHDDWCVVVCLIGGGQEISADLLIFVDDDNVLQRDYLEAASRIAVTYPHLGAFGGSIEASLKLNLIRVSKPSGPA